jgi:hypothetical protein
LVCYQSSSDLEAVVKSQGGRGAETVGSDGITVPTAALAVQVSISTTQERGIILVLTLTQHVEQAAMTRRSHDQGSSLRKNSTAIRFAIANQHSMLTSHSVSEKKIDRIGDRLANIESYLRRLPAASSPVSHGSVPSLAQTPANAFASPSNHSLSISSGAYAEHATATDAFDATHSTHSVHASKVIEQAVGSSSSMNRNPALTSALASLKGMLGGINENPSTADVSTTLWNRPMEKAPPPSRAEIYEILRRADSKYV